MLNLIKILPFVTHQIERKDSLAASLILFFISLFIFNRERIGCAMEAFILFQPLFGELPTSFSLEQDTQSSSVDAFKKQQHII